jgi:hypothetical protein
MYNHFEWAECVDTAYGSQTIGRMILALND